MRIRYSTGKNGRREKKAIVYTKDEHGINLADVDSDAVFVVERLKAAGHDTYVVGGAVRDLILGKKPKDFDIVTDANPSRIKKVFRNSRIIGHRFRLVHVYFGPKIFEVSTFRSIKDGSVSNIFGDIEEDVLRRDFTLNALFYDPQQEVVVDYVGGVRDIRRKRVRPIIPLKTIFSDDPVRMVRAAKYAAATGFTLPLTVQWKIRKQSPLLSGISPSRLTEEINKIIRSPAAAKITAKLDSLGLWEYLQPSAAKLFREKAGFKDRYLAAMERLANTAAPAGGPAAVVPEPVLALVRDFLEDEAPWEREGLTHQEIYRDAFIAARKFVLPMNPPRMELDRAVRMLLAEQGITIKKSRFQERARPRRGGADGRPRGQNGDNGGADNESSGVSAAKPKRRRRKRRGKSGGAEG